MTKVIIKSKWRVWLRKLLLLLMTSPLRCYLSLSSETTLNYASNMLYMSELLLWELNYRHGYSFHFRRDDLGHSNEVCWKPGSPLVDADLPMRPLYAGRHHGSGTACIMWVYDWRSELHFMLSKTGGENSFINGELPLSLQFAIWMQLCKSNLKAWWEKLCIRMWVWSYQRIFRPDWLMDVIVRE